MTFTPDFVPQVGDFAPDCLLPDGSHLSALRGQPVILAFAPEQWNPAHAYQSEVFAQLSREFGDGAAFVDAARDDWHALDAAGDLAAQFGVFNRRALFLLDESGVLKWKIEVEDGQTIHPGEVLAALESLHEEAVQGADNAHSESREIKRDDSHQLSRRAFLTATLAAAAILTLPLAAEAGGRTMLPLDQVRRERRDYPGNKAPDKAGTVPVTLNINGQNHQLQIEPRVALLDALRENLHLTGSKKGCDHGQCGACTVHINGVRALSCLSLAVMNEGKSITTIEGLSSGETLHPVQASFLKHDAFQCGYCTPGQIMSAVALIKEGRAKSEAEIREAMSGNLCRCAAYPNIIAAVKDAQSA